MEDEDFGPELTAAERRDVDKKAKAAAELAVYERAKELLPFNKKEPPLEVLQDNQRRVASWLLVKADMKKFYDRTFNNAQGLEVMGSGRVIKHGGSVAGLFNAQGIKSFAHLCQEVAKIFCGHTDSDEIRELRGMQWSIDCDFYPLVSKPPAPYVNKPTRMDRIQQGGSSDLWSIVQKRRSRNRDANLISEGPFVVDVVRALDTKLERELNDVRTATYKEASAEEEAAVRTNITRNAKLEKIEQRRGERAERRENGGGRFRFRKR